MKKFRIYGNRSSQETALEKENRLIAREVAAEGFVLLENNGVLPLAPCKIALFGGGARMTIKGGSGSGNVRERYSVNIEDGLKNNGYSIVATSWLQRFTAARKKEEKDFHDMVEEKIKGYPVWRVMDMFNKISEYKLDYPVGDEIKDEDLNEETDTCIYVIARQAGEGFDREVKKGDYLLSDLEVKNLRKCRAYFKKLIVILNCGSSIDMSELADIHADAILFYGQAGEEGGNALGEVLSGKKSPSGRLSDTWAHSYEDYPFSKTANTSKTDEDYIEGIYVGYRYFDAAGVKPYYPFGYGLSYTKFEHSFKDLEVTGSQVFVDVKVTNVGSTSGKDVVFLFLYKPNQRYKGELKSLAAFKKTKQLEAGEAEILRLRFDMTDFAVYDEAADSFILEEGRYGISMGKDALHDELVCAAETKKDSIVEVCKSLLEKKADFKDLEFETKCPDLRDLPCKSFDVETKINDYDYILPKAKEKIENCLSALSDEELAMFGMGGGYFSKPYIKVLGACGNTTSLLLKKGIPGIIMSDGPAGINIMPQTAYSRSGQTRYIDDLPEEWKWGWLKHVIPKLRFLFAGKNDIYCYQYCTAFPNATMMAQSFNTKLVEKAGVAIGKEMLNMGVTLWLAPALNIHRDPLCGRNFEYYSEDPIVSGLMAAAMIKGVQSNQGVGVTIKHIACNNRENQRMKVSSNLSKRALREIYLKGFKIACREKPMAMMSSYNKINGIYAPNCRELLIDILRCEWGYEGLVMSDWNAVEQCSYEEAIRSGNNMIMPGTKKTYEELCKALKENRLSRKDISVSAYYALKMIFSAKTSEDFIKENNL